MKSFLPHLLPPFLFILPEDVCDLSKLRSDRMKMVVEGVKNFSEWGKKLLGDEGKKLLRNNREIH